MAELGFSLECSAVPNYVSVNQNLELLVTARKGHALHKCDHRLRVLAISSQSDKILQSQFDTESAKLRDGISCVTVAVLEGAIAERNGQPSLCFFQVDALGEENEIIASGKTSLFIPICYRVQVVEERKEKYEFYKDVGGKDKGIELQISLVNVSGSQKEDKSISVAPVLLYEDGKLVPDQTILQTSDDLSAMQLRAGETKELKFRIAQVSSKHSNKAFCIKLEPNLILCPSAADVMPGASVPVEVRSKIKRPASQTVQAEREAEQHYQKRIRSEHSSQRVSPYAGINNRYDAHTTEYIPIPHALLESSAAFVEALDVLQGWSHEVSVALETKVKWKPIGYETVEGQRGKVFLYDIHNPNDTIQAILQQYREKVVHSIKSLEHFKNLMQSVHLLHPSSDQPAGGETNYINGILPRSATSTDIDPNAFEFLDSSADVPREAIFALRDMKGGGHSSNS